VAFVSENFTAHFLPETYRFQSEQTTPAGYCEPLLRIEAMPRQAEAGAFENLLEGGRKAWLHVRKRMVEVGRIQSIIRNYDEVVEVESHPGVFFEQTACLERGSKDRCQVFDGRQSRGRLAAVHQAGSALTHIDAEVSFMRDEQNTWPVLDVAVIVNVDQ